MDTNMILWIALIMYLMIILFGFYFQTKWLFMIAGLLWFIPIFEVDDMFIKLVSAIMVLFHGILGFYEAKGSDF